MGREVRLPPPPEPVSVRGLASAACSFVTHAPAAPSRPARRTTSEQTRSCGSGCTACARPRATCCAGTWATAPALARPSPPPASGRAAGSPLHVKRVNPPRPPLQLLGERGDGLEGRGLCRAVRPRRCGGGAGVASPGPSVRAGRRLQVAPPSMGPVRDPARHPRATRGAHFAGPTRSGLRRAGAPHSLTRGTHTHERAPAAARAAYGVCRGQVAPSHSCGLLRPHAGPDHECSDARVVPAV